MLGSRDTDKGQMRFLNILKCLYRLPENRDSLKSVKERMDGLEVYAAAVTNDRIEPLEAALRKNNEAVDRANFELIAARLDALEHYVSALTEDRIKPVEAQLQALRDALERYAAGRNRAGSVIANQTPSPGPEVRCPLPEGLGSREKALEMFLTVSIDGAPRDELRSYAEADCDRFLHTLNLVRPDAKRLLEIGANPYFSSILFKEFRSAELDFTNYFYPEPKGETQSVRYENHQGKKRKWLIDYAKVNTEKTLLPAKDGAFDHVVFCEVLEHLTSDPLFSLIEINRVLQIGGALVLSTPNVARLENTAALLSGANMCDPYSGYGPYGRHNREYTGQELNWLLQYTGFEVETFFTPYASPDNAARYFDVETLKPLVEFREQELGHYMLVRAVKRRNVPSSLKRPKWLYRSLEEPEDMADLTLLDDPLAMRAEG